MEHEKRDLFMTIDGVWMVIIEDSNEYEVAERQKDGTFMYYVFPELDELVEENKLTKKGKAEKALYRALEQHDDGVGVPKIAKFGGYEPDELRNEPEELVI